MFFLFFFLSNLTEMSFATDICTRINSLEDFLLLGLLSPIYAKCTFSFFPPPLFQVLNQSQRVLHSNQLSGPIPATWFPVPPAFPYLQHLCVSVFFCFFFYIFLTVHSKITVHKSIEWTTSFQLVCFVQ